VSEVIQAEFHTRHRQLDSMLVEIKDVIYAYAGQIPVAAVLGVLRIIEHDLIRDNCTKVQS